jgi:hypothetical protein
VHCRLVLLFDIVIVVQLSSWLCFLICAKIDCATMVQADEPVLIINMDFGMSSITADLAVAIKLRRDSMNCKRRVGAAQSCKS